jgi:hypothetical protein
MGHSATQNASPDIRVLVRSVGNRVQRDSEMTVRFVANPNHMAAALAMPYGMKANARMRTGNARKTARCGIRNAALAFTMSAVAYVAQIALQICRTSEFPAKRIAMGVQPERRSMHVRMATKKAPRTRFVIRSASPSSRVLARFAGRRARCSL